jgi:type II secretory pathway pseudopilin PulG
MFQKRFKKAETLVEILIALFVISITTGAASVMIVSSLRSNAEQKDEIIAINLAREGLEAVQNIRDTNWLICRNTDQQTLLSYNINKIADCYDSNHPKFSATLTHFRVGTDLAFDSAASDGFGASLAWMLQSITNNVALNLDNVNNSNDFYRLDIIDRFASLDSDGDGNQNNDLDIYTHTDYPAGNPTDKGTRGTKIIESKFHRMVQVQALNNATNTGTELQVVVTVQWKAGNATRQVSLQTTLANYK